jgi:hypothetical protein
LNWRANTLRYNVVMEILLAAGSGVGIASVAGVRAFLPLALVAVLAQLGLFELPAPYDAAVGWLAVAVLAALAVLEILADKIRTLARGFNIAMVPVRAAAGAVLFAVAYGPQAPAVYLLAAGAVVAGLIAVLKVLLRPSSGSSTAGVSTAFLSTSEDVVAVVGALLALLVPFLPLLLVAFMLFFYFRVRRRRGRKYGGLRILGD